MSFSIFEILPCQNLIKENIKKCGLWPIENEIPFVFEPYVPAV
jgi:hypothetical protein